LLHGRIIIVIVPIVGMLAGSTISGMVIALMEVLKEVQENRDKVETSLAFGASRMEACKPIAQHALLVALTPVVNQMRCVYPNRGRLL
jgi:ABC-type iron transport system FetAB permease component